jgi:hypothetical protein
VQRGDLPVQVRRLSLDSRPIYSPSDYLERVSCGDFVSVSLSTDTADTPCRLGLFIGSIPGSLSSDYDATTETLAVRYDFFLPLIFLPLEKRSVLGYACSWSRIDSQAELEACRGSDEEENPWFAAARRALGKERS